MVKKKRAIFAVVGVFLIALLLNWLLNTRGQTDIAVNENVERVNIYSSAFEDGGLIPVGYTGDGEDISPGFEIEGLSDTAVSIAIIMEDLDVPWKSNYTHWVIWNIQPTASIPEAIPHGENVLDGAVQGVAYGTNKYRGPNPPFGTHRYQFHIFVLDCMLDLDSSSGKTELLAAMENQMLQYGTITGWYTTAK